MAGPLLRPWGWLGAGGVWGKGVAGFAGAAGVGQGAATGRVGLPALLPAPASPSNPHLPTHPTLHAQVKSPVSSSHFQEELMELLRGVLGEPG